MLEQQHVGHAVAVQVADRPWRSEIGRSTTKVLVLTRQCADAGEGGRGQACDHTPGRRQTSGVVPRIAYNLPPPRPYRSASPSPSRLATPSAVTPGQTWASR